eukprot:m.184414 g.184414  ORF g.184414 m.184414 type:complete len:512 (+) comp32187_c0_seq2:119-1654(+)
MQYHGRSIARGCIAVLTLYLTTASAHVQRVQPAPFDPLLFMDLVDTSDAWGLLEPTANTVVANASYRPPPLNYSLGSQVLSVIVSASDANVFEVYVENTTGWEPLVDNVRTKGYHDCSLLRYTTADFVNYSPPHVSLLLPGCAGTPTMKSIARNEDGLYVMFTVGGPPHSNHTFTTFLSHDQGLSWDAADTTGIAFPDKDDLNIIYNQGRFVDMQIVWQNWSLRYCDNGGCDQRRVISAKTSADGVTWGDDLPLRTPDNLDPPELQFYRCRPFYVGNSSRLVAHTLLYAPAPSQEIVGKSYGRHPSECTGNKTRGDNCHGPHLYEEWWVGPPNGDAADTLAWRRPYRRTHAAPRDAFLMAPPVQFRDELVWVGSTGLVYTLPLYRIAGVYAPANGEFNTVAFTMPRAPMWINADAQWHGQLNTTFEGVRGCDEGCAAYLYAAVLDAATGDELPGYGVRQANVLMNIDGQKLPLQWRDGDGNSTLVDTSPLAGRAVRLRLYFRDTIVYAVGA